MKRTTFTLAAAAMLAACSPAATASSDRSTTMTDQGSTHANKQLVRRLYEEAINARRLELIHDLVAAEYVGPTGERGAEGFAQTIGSVLVGFPDVQFTIEDLIAEHDRVTVRWSLRGTHTGQLRTFAPTGRPVTNTGIAIYQLRDGHIVRAWLETDRLGVLQAIGAVPTPPPPTAGATP